MEEYAHRKNIERFERELSAETDPDKRRMLEQLLAEERSRLKTVLRQKGKPAG